MRSAARIETRSRLLSASFEWQASDGSWFLTLVCKASFDLMPGSSPIAASQDGIDEVDDHWDDDATRSLRRASDMVPFKRHVDVVVVGHAFGAEREARFLTARLAVGSIDKRVDVWCDRAWIADRRLVDRGTFRKMSLRWERAAFGAHGQNPVGLRPGARDERGFVVVPNLVPHGHRPSDPDELIAPACFGPIASTWSDRALLAPPSWSARELDAAPLHPEVDAAFFNAAPADQRLEALRLGESITLEHFHRDHPRLTTVLAAEPVRAIVKSGRAHGTHALRCDTLAIDTDNARASLTWRCELPLERAGAALDITVFAGNDAPIDIMDETVEPGGADAPALPFRVGFSTLARTVLGRETLPLIAEEDTQHAADEHTAHGGHAGDALPFRAAESPLATPLLEHPHVVEDEDIDEPPPSSRGTAVLDEIATPREPDWLGPSAHEEEIDASALDGGGLPLEHYPIERCAKIAASLACRPLDKPRILAEHDLDGPTWRALVDHHEDALEAEARRGLDELLMKQDEAYVDQIERERGAITPGEYARLVVAAERGDEATASRDLGIPEDSLMIVERVFTRRAMDDEELSDRFDQAIEAARDA